MTTFFTQNRGNRHIKKWAAPTLIAGAIASIWAGSEIPWNPILSVVIFIAFGLTLPFLWKYGIKGDDPKEVTNKLENFFSFGKKKTPTAQQSKNPQPVGGYRERFN